MLTKKNYEALMQEAVGTLASLASLCLLLWFVPPQVMFELMSLMPHLESGAKGFVERPVMQTVSRNFELQDFLTFGASGKAEELRCISTSWYDIMCSVLHDSIAKRFQEKFRSSKKFALKVFEVIGGQGRSALLPDAACYLGHFESTYCDSHLHTDNAPESVPQFNGQK
ncbi:hypothetical protein KIN20_004643 [Parelaphostrongylus tenuis]|uniref:Uncharacterized protein n=1 Tax=Parelaphostrongylus tenuis TaxID=148309 RepID=A0AAD5M3E3_PARTN|nr:hypothetical protein KIN20_004643 [Parelaphostrongylus tenuis]